MRTTLADIATLSDDQNPFVGERSLRELRSMLQLPGYTARLLPDQRWKFFLDLGVRELRIGNERDAIRHLEKALSTVPETSNPSRVETLTHYHLGVAGLRLAETENCCALQTADSCIVPIQGGGIHQRQEGSRQAIEHFLHVLRSSTSVVAENERLETHESARWLLNIASMTLGEYPDGVPQEYRVPTEFFRSNVDFPKFRNVLPKLNLDTLSLCGGVVVDDLDGDLDLDVATCTWDVTGQLRLFRNEGNGQFTDVTESSGLLGFYGGLNLNQADFDNDGDLDLFVMRGAWLGHAGCHPNSLLRNDGDFKFTDVTFELGLAEPFFPTKTAAWADFDNDGDLDLYVGNESSEIDVQADSSQQPLVAPCQLFRNDGAAGFTDVAQQAGIADARFSMGAVWGDYDNDGYPDLFLSLVGNNILYHNNRDGTFTDVTAEAGVAEPPSSFATWFFDYDNDGWLDLYVGCNSGPVGVLDSAIRFHQMKLYRNTGDGKFRDVADQVKLNYPAEPMGAGFGDLNNDGYLDFYLATGNVSFSEVRPNVMFLNQQGTEFANVTMAGGFGHLQKGHGVSFADMNNDGSQDVYVQLGGAYAGDRANDALFMNPGSNNNFVKLAVQGVTSNRCGIGVRIALEIEEAEKHRTIYHHVSTGSSFGSNPLLQTIGIGMARHIQKMTVYWPTSGLRQEFRDVPANSSFRIIEGRADLVPLMIHSFDFTHAKDTAE